MIYLKKFNEGSDETTNFNSFLSKLDDLKAICDGQLATLYDEGFELDYLVTRTTIPQDRLLQYVLPCLHIQFANFRKSSSFTWDEVKDYFIPLLQLLSRRYKILPYFDTRTKQLKMRQEDREKVMLRTQVCFQLGHHQSDYVYVSLQDVINDNIGTKIDKNIFSISINIGGEL